MSYWSSRREDTETSREAILKEKMTKNFSRIKKELNYNKMYQNLRSIRKVGL